MIEPKEKHSSLVGGSSAGRYINCIGSTALKKLAPPGGSSPAAQLGTALHYVIEQVALAEEDHPDFSPENFIGDMIELDGLDDKGEPIFIEMTDELITTKIMPAAEVLDSLELDQYWCEIEVRFEGELAEAFGTADILFVNDDRAGLLDWKFGDNVMVSAENNDQLKFYLAAALHLRWFAEATKHLDEFEGWIVQPVEGREDISSRAIYTRKDLIAFEVRLLDAKYQKNAGYTKTTIGSWCKFCPAEAICPAYMDRGKKALEAVPCDTLKKGKAKVDYDHKALREAYAMAQELSPWVDAVKRLVKAEFDANRPIDGLKKVIYQKVRNWANENKLRRWLNKLGFKAKDYNVEPAIQSVAKIEKLVGKAKLKERPDLVQTFPKGFSYVPVDDPRPAYEDGNDEQSVSKQLASSLQQNESEKA